MEKITDKVEAFINQFNELEKLARQSNKDLSNIDLELSNYYHKIEGVIITHVSQSHKMIKELQNILVRRRQIKMEDIILRGLCDNLRDKIKIVQTNTTNAIVKTGKIKESVINKPK